MDKRNLLPGTILQLGDWDYGWMCKATILSKTPKGQRYRIQIDGAKKTSTIAVSEVVRGYQNLESSPSVTILHHVSLPLPID